MRTCAVFVATFLITSCEVSDRGQTKVTVSQFGKYEGYSDSESIHNEWFRSSRYVSI